MRLMRARGWRVCVALACAVPVLVAARGGAMQGADPAQAHLEMGYTYFGLGWNELGIEQFKRAAA
ncbi:MAG TPA: hypothetical protein VF234_01445, partial [Limnochordia bacterium]